MLNREIVVGDEKNGSSVIMTVGQVLTVRLKYRRDERDDAGTYWLLDTDGAPVLRLLDSDPGVADQGVGTHQWRFKVTEAGGVRVQMSYKQKWDGAAVRRFRLTVTAT